MAHMEFSERVIGREAEWTLPRQVCTLEFRYTLVPPPPYRGLLCQLVLCVPDRFLGLLQFLAHGCPARTKNRIAHNCIQNQDQPTLSPAPPTPRL